jgi:hypothetical protein
VSHCLSAVISGGLALLVLLLPGCKPEPAASPAPPGDQAAKEQAARDLSHTTWDVYYLKNVRVGYGKTTVRSATDAGRDVLHIEQWGHVAVKRGKDRTQQDIRSTSVETPDGELLRFTCEMQAGPSPMRTVGQVKGDRLELETITAGKRVATTIPWSARWGGPFASEQTLLRKPMQPGERRSLKALIAEFSRPAEIEMQAKDYEPTPLLGGTHDLLRIDTVRRFADGRQLEATVWANRAGNTMKVFSAAMEITSYRASEAEAMAKVDAAELDLLGATLVSVDRPLKNPHQTKRVRCRVHLDRGDPAGVFVSGPTQQVKPLDAHSAEVTVYAIRPRQGDGNPAAPADLPTDADRRPNAILQSDDPEVVAQAKQAVGADTDPWRVAVDLERYVNRVIVKKDYSQAFATAAEVAKSHEGDCTEHAVFLAALARARGIPARAAMGLVYAQAQGKTGFLYHMWTEVYVDGRWIPIDGTLAIGGIGAAHLKLAESNFSEASPYSAFLPVVQVVGRLKIEIIDAE